MSLTAKFCLLATLSLPVASADSLNVVNPNFSAVAIQCSGFAYQSAPGGTCAGPNVPQQDFNSGFAIGWTFAPFMINVSGAGDGITNPGSVFSPPSFSGLPFSEAALLQGPTSAMLQTITGFVPGGQYTLSFYLGSRYAAGCCDGNQIVSATLDNQLIGAWKLVSFTPFTLRTASFGVTSGGSHILSFQGNAQGDHTAFLSGVSIGTISNLTVSPSSVSPGTAVTVSANGFAPSDTVNLFAYAVTPVMIGTGTADSSGAVSVQGVIPATPFGTCGLQAVGQSGGTVASGTIAIAPRLFAHPKSGKVGDTISVQGFGFAAVEPVSVNWLHPPALLGTPTTARNGSFPTLTFTIPPGAFAGVNQVVVSGLRSGATAVAQILVK